MNLIAYSFDNKPLFARKCKNKQEAFTEVIKSGYFYAIDYVKFKNKKYNIDHLMDKWSPRREVFGSYYETE